MGDNLLLESTLLTAGLEDRLETNRTLVPVVMGSKWWDVRVQ
ncbi:hypothetical protein RISK_002586 [Rhodopirellula islandica]|uniref:Uncharacterized protein n=1 Tax=Rhodopirellula islandica TaxID=595434 RepID=A0A0J1EIR6_RHOIS|nr:hypothetical protein RISK_002586 [Rhodopirellula islandica]